MKFQREADAWTGAGTGSEQAHGQEQDGIAAALAVCCFSLLFYALVRFSYGSCQYYQSWHFRSGAILPTCTPLTPEKTEVVH